MLLTRLLSELGSASIRDGLGVEADPAVRPAQQPEHGDYQLNGLLALGRSLRRPPRELAAAVADRLAGHDPFERVEVAGPGFVNLRLRDAWIAERLGDVLADRARDGVPAVDRPETIVVDFSSPNVAKQMHVGHLRSTILGDAIVRLLRFLGHRVLGDNHLGDWGTQFGLLLAGIKRWGSQVALEGDAVAELERIYRLASEAARADEAFADEARAELARLQSGDPERRAQWQRFVEQTRRTLERVYDRLGVRFDLWLGESSYEAMLPGVVEELLRRGIAREDQGAVCVFVGELPEAPEALRGRKEPFIVRKKDGAFLYSTTDIATVLYRRDTLRADRVLYVVDVRQADHFAQLFATVRAMGVTMRLEHVGFGTILGEDGRPLRTRDGAPVTLEALLDEAVTRAEARLRQAEGLELDPAAIGEVARAVGIGAVKYADLRQHRLTDYRFEWDKLLSFKGNAGPYLQYAYARTRSVFRRGAVDPDTLAGPIVLREPPERALALVLLRFGDVVHAAADGALPHLVAEHLYEVAVALSTFYERCRVLHEDAAVRASRLALLAVASRQLRRGLELLGITAIERM
ncbi:MAG: arginine--tRNA ligase [Myxococcota bacterium]|nr:arginine--tRNA ligase [Myxococcota bacterium]MDW8363291.1 arginine--tRNA ligase [Myxococcales bacterium]